VNSNDIRLEVVDCQVQPTDKNALYGAVSSGFLKVKGRIRTVEWRNFRGTEVTYRNTVEQKSRADFAPEFAPDIKLPLIKLTATDNIRLGNHDH
jgi:hypothetical protein